MIDQEVMHRFIREANPIASADDLDEDELQRFVATVDLMRTDAFPVEPVPARTSLVVRRGPALAFATAAAIIIAVGLGIVLARPFGGEEVSPVATGEPDTTLPVPNQALYIKQLVPHPLENPVPLSTAIGNLEFEMLQFDSPAYNLWHVYWTKHSIVSVANERLYWSTDYYNWESIGPVSGGMVTVIDDDVIVHGGRGDAVRYAWDGEAWVEDGLVFAADVEQFAFGDAGAVALDGDRFLFSIDGVHFSPAEQAPSSVEADRGWCPEGHGPFVTEPLVAATNVGFVALVPTSSAWWSEDPVCESVVWFSADGNEWELVSAESPFGEESAVFRVAERGGRFVAAGAAYLAPAVIWVSDDGIVWDRIHIDLQVIDGLFAGELGWVITGAQSNYDRQVIMFSANGITWDGPYERPETLNTGYLPPQMAVGDDVLFGIGGGHPEVLIARLQE